MPAAARLDLIMTAQDKISKVLQSVDKSLVKTKNAAERMQQELGKGGKDQVGVLAKMRENWQGIATKAGIAGVAIGGVVMAGKKLFDVAKAGAAINDQMSILERQGIDVARIMGEAREATAGTISDRELMSALTRFKGFGLDLELFAKSMEGAAKASVLTGRSVDFMVEKLVTGLVRQSPKLLDDLMIKGVMVSDVSARMARDFGAVAENLGDAERQAALHTIALEKLGQVTESVNLKTDSQSAALARVSVAWENWTDGVKTWMAEVAVELLDLFENMGKAIDDAAEKMEAAGRTPNPWDPISWTGAGPEGLSPWEYFQAAADGAAEYIFEVRVAEQAHESFEEGIGAMWKGFVSGVDSAIDAVRDLTAEVDDGIEAWSKLDQEMIDDPDLAGTTEAQRKRIKAGRKRDAERQKRDSARRAAQAKRDRERAAKDAAARAKQLKQDQTAAAFLYRQTKMQADLDAAITLEMREQLRISLLRLDIEERILAASAEMKSAAQKQGALELKIAYEQMGRTLREAKEAASEQEWAKTMATMDGISGRLSNVSHEAGLMARAGTDLTGVWGAYSKGQIKVAEATAASVGAIGSAAQGFIEDTQAQAVIGALMEVANAAAAFASGNVVAGAAHVAAAALYSVVAATTPTKGGGGGGGGGGGVATGGGLSAYGAAGPVEAGEGGRTVIIQFGSGVVLGRPQDVAAAIGDAQAAAAGTGRGSGRGY